MKKLFCWSVLSALVLTGCAGPFSRPSKLMQKTSMGLQAPPDGKALVLIHRPRQAQGSGLYTGVWDSHDFIADLGNGHSVAYICDPGDHYFINRSVERVGVVEANLLPDQTYALWIDICGQWVASFQLEPVKLGDRSARKKVERCEKENIWVTRGTGAAAHEAARQNEIDLILKDFVHGPKQDRVRHLGPNDHR